MGEGRGDAEGDSSNGLNGEERGSREPGAERAEAERAEAERAEAERAEADGAILNTRDFVRGVADATGASGAAAGTRADTGAGTGAGRAEGRAAGTAAATLNTRGLTATSTGSSTTTDSLTLAGGSAVGGDPDNSSKNSGCSFCSVIQSARIKLNHADEFSGTIY